MPGFMRLSGIMTSVLIVVATSWCVAATPATAQAEGGSNSVHLRSLRAVQDAKLKLRPWREAVDETAARLGDEKDRKELSDRMTAAAPRIAAALERDPGDSAIVTIVVDQTKDQNAALHSVVFEGVGDAAAIRIVPQVIADTPTTAPATARAEGAVVDPGATTYLCYYLDHGDLKAGAISFDAMKKSVAVSEEMARRGEGAPLIGELPRTSGAPATPEAQARDERIRAAEDRQRTNTRDTAPRDARNDPNTRTLDTGVVDYGWAPQWGGQSVVIFGPLSAGGGGFPTTRPVNSAEAANNAAAQTEAVTASSTNPPENGRPQPMVPSRTPPNTMNPQRTPGNSMNPQQTPANSSDAPRESKSK